MKNLKQLVLPCYKMEMAMNVEAWYFLHGTTNGVCNLTYFRSLLSGMAVTEVSKTKRGLGYVLHPGQGGWLHAVTGKGVEYRAQVRLPSVGGFFAAGANPCCFQSRNLYHLYGVRKVVDDRRTAHGKSDIPTGGQGIRGSTHLPFQRAKTGNSKEKFGKNEKAQGQGHE